MGVTVHSRLGDVLRDHGLSVNDLQRQLAARFGLAVDVRTLDRLARADRVRRPDLELAAASAEALGIGLSDIFAVETAADNETAPNMDGLRLDDEGDNILDPKQSRRLQSLYERQHRRALTDAEWAEMGALVDEWGRRVYERGVQDIAAQRGQPVEQVRSDLAAERDRIVRWRRELDADPARLKALIDEARERQRVRASG